jgi:hypothetical protein
MKRRRFIGKAVALSGTLLAAPAARTLFAVEASKNGTLNESKRQLNPPANGRIPVAFVISEGVTVIDFAGPWEVFQDVMVVDEMPFELFTVSDKIETIIGTAGLKLIPNYTFANVPFAEDRCHNVGLHRRVPARQSRIAQWQVCYDASRLYR